MRDHLVINEGYALLFLNSDVLFIRQKTAEYDTDTRGNSITDHLKSEFNLNFNGYNQKQSKKGFIPHFPAGIPWGNAGSPIPNIGRRCRGVA